MAILDDRTLDFISHSETQTVRLGVRLGELLQPFDLLCLSGDLGSGKTVLARGIGRGWGTGVRVTSPTFTLVNEYPRLSDGMILYHLDAYRLNSWGDVVTMGLEDLLDERAVMMIEWADNVADFLPASFLNIHLSYNNETKRNIRMTAQGERAEELLKTFKKSAFGR
jgi:tRNA threonylcarbamoyladenosine biosynthesis protein TsaE